MDLLAIVAEPGKVSRQRPLRRIGILWLALPLRLYFFVVGCSGAAVFLDVGRGGESAAQKGRHVQLAEVEVLAAPEHGVGVTNVGASGVPQRALERHP